MTEQEGSEIANGRSQKSNGRPSKNSIVKIPLAGQIIED